MMDSLKKFLYLTLALISSVIISQVIFVVIIFVFFFLTSYAEYSSAMFSELSYLGWLNHLISRFYEEHRLQMIVSHIAVPLIALYGAGQYTYDERFKSFCKNISLFSVSGVFFVWLFFVVIKFLMFLIGIIGAIDPERFETIVSIIAGILTIIVSIKTLSK